MTCPTWSLFFFWVLGMPQMTIGVYPLPTTGGPSTMPTPNETSVQLTTPPTRSGNSLTRMDSAELQKAASQTPETDLTGENTHTTYPTRQWYLVKLEVDLTAEKKTTTFPTGQWYLVKLEIDLTAEKKPQLSRRDSGT